MLFAPLHLDDRQQATVLRSVNNEIIGARTCFDDGEQWIVHQEDQADPVLPRLGADGELHAALGRNLPGPLYTEDKLFEEGQPLARLLRTLLLSVGPPVVTLFSHDPWAPPRWRSTGAAARRRR